MITECILHVLTYGTFGTQVFIKIMPSDDMHKGLILNQAMDVTEVKSYETFFPDLAKFEKEQDEGVGDSDSIVSIAPRMYSAGCDMSADRRSFYVMLEDMSPEYEMKDFGAGLTLQQLLNSMKALARYHATCYAYGKLRNVDFRAKYGDFFSKFFESFDTDKELADFMEHNMDLVEADMRESQVEDLVPQVKRLRKDIGKKFKNVIRGSQNETKEFVMHGDIW